MYFKKFIVACLFCSFILTPCYGVNPFREGVAHFEAGNFERAKERFCPLARKGSILAQAYVERIEEIQIGAGRNPDRFKPKKPFDQMSSEEQEYVRPAKEWVEASVVRLMFTGNSRLIEKNEGKARSDIRDLIENNTANANAWRVYADIDPSRRSNSLLEAFKYGDYDVARQLSVKQLSSVVAHNKGVFLSVLERLESDEDESIIYYELFKFFRNRNKIIAGIYLRMAVFHGNGDALFPYLEGGYLSSEREGDRMVQWFAEYGHKKALCTIGYYYEHGEHGFDLDLRKAAGFYRDAAAGDDGYSIAQFNYGICLRRSIGTKRNLEGALQQFRRAFKGGHKDAADEVRDTLQELYATKYSQEGEEEDFSEDFSNLLALARSAEAIGSSGEEISSNIVVVGSSAAHVTRTTIAPRSNASPAAAEFYREAMEVLGEVPLKLYTQDTWKLLVNLLVVHRQQGTNEQWAYVEAFLNKDKGQYLLLLSELYRNGGGLILPQVDLANEYLRRAINTGDPKALVKASFLSVSELTQLGVSLGDFRRRMIEGVDPKTNFALALDSYEEGNLEDAEGYYRAFLPHDADGYGHRNLAITLLDKRGGDSFNEEEITLLQQALERGCFEVFNDLGVDAYRQGRYGDAYGFFLQAQEKGRSKPLFIVAAHFMVADSQAGYAAVKTELEAALEGQNVKPEQRHEAAVMFLGLASRFNEGRQLEQATDSIQQALIHLTIAAEADFLPSLELKLKLEQFLWDLRKQITDGEKAKHVKENARLLVLQGRSSSEESFEDILQRSLNSGALNTLADLLDPDKPSVNKDDLKTLLGQLAQLSGVEEASMGPSSKGFKARFGDSVLGMHFKHKPGKGNAEVRGGRKASAAKVVKDVLEKAKRAMDVNEQEKIRRSTNAGEGTSGGAANF